MDVTPSASPASGRSPETEERHRPDLARACAEFEALFLQQLFQQMRATVPRESGADGGAGQLYGELCDAEVARSLSRGRGIGLADILYRQMLRRLEADGETAPAPGTQAAHPCTAPGRKER